MFNHKAMVRVAPSFSQVMDVLGKIQLSIGQINTRLDSMHECLNSLSTQVANIDRKVSLGVSMEELHGDPAQSRSSEATQSPLYA